MKWRNLFPSISPVNLILSEVFRVFPLLGRRIIPHRPSRHTYLSSNSLRLPHNPRSHRRKRISRIAALPPSLSLSFFALYFSYLSLEGSREASVARVSRAIELSRPGCNFVDLRWIEAASRISAPIHRRSFNAG